MNTHFEHSLSFKRRALGDGISAERDIDNPHRVKMSFGNGLSATYARGASGKVVNVTIDSTQMRSDEPLETLIGKGRLRRAERMAEKFLKNNIQA